LINPVTGLQMWDGKSVLLLFFVSVIFSQCRAYSVSNDQQKTFCIELSNWLCGSCFSY